MQYVSKKETNFNIKLNNHSKDTRNKNPTLPRKHFQNSDYNFRGVVKFTLFEQITKAKQFQLLLKKQENVNYRTWKLGL